MYYVDEDEDNVDLAVALSKLSRMKMLEDIDSGEPVDLDDLIYNLDCLIDYFVSIKHKGAAHDLRWAKRIIEEWR